MWIKLSYVAIILYVTTLIVFTLAYLQGVDLFWWAAPITIICGGFLGAVWHLRRRNKI
jgi:hypothetical protein